MPELPEVESARRALLAWLPGRIDAVSVFDPSAVRTRLSTSPSDAVVDGDAAARDLFEGAVTVRIERHGKRLGWILKRGRAERAVLMHLGMTGRLVRRTSSEVPGAGVRLAWRAGDTWVWFEDARRFGCVSPVPVAAMDARLRDGHGPDALDAPLDAAGLGARVTGRRAVKDALMDQAVVAGLGNIHVVEALWRARVHPDTRADDVSAAGWKRLAAAIPTQLAAFVEEPDREVRYMNLGGDNPFRVYGREGEPCPRCGGPIARTAKGRSTYFCPACQRWRGASP